MTTYLDTTARDVTITAEPNTDPVRSALWRRLWTRLLAPVEDERAEDAAEDERAEDERAEDAA